jgi:hypothetical protein
MVLNLLVGERLVDTCYTEEKTTPANEARLRGKTRGQWPAGGLCALSHEVKQ